MKGDGVKGSVDLSGGVSTADVGGVQLRSGGGESVASGDVVILSV
jgi:hypothetical protein